MKNFSTDLKMHYYRVELASPIKKKSNVRFTITFVIITLQYFILNVFCDMYKQQYGLLVYSLSWEMCVAACLCINCNFFKILFKGLNISRYFGNISDGLYIMVQ